MWYCLPRSFFTKEKRAFFLSGSFQLWQRALVEGSGHLRARSSPPARVWSRTGSSGVPYYPRCHMKQFWFLKQAQWQPPPPWGWGAGNQLGSLRMSCCPVGWRSTSLRASPTGERCPTLPCSHLEKPGADTSPKATVCVTPSSALFPPSPSFPSLTLLLTLSSPSSGLDVALQPSFCRRWFPAAGSHSSP